MGKGNGFAEFFVQLQAFADCAGNLGNLNAVGQAGAVVLAFVIGENLRFAVQPAESRGMNQPVAVTLKRRTDNVGKICIHPSPAFFRGKGIVCKLHFFPFPMT